MPRRVRSPTVRILHLTSGAKWTGPAAVAVAQVAALRDSGIEAEIAIAGGSPLSRRLESEGWARPLLARGRRPKDFLQDVARLHETLGREKFDLVQSHSSHDHLVACAALSAAPIPLVRSFHHAKAFRHFLARWGRRRASGFAFSSAALQETFAVRFSPRAPCARFSPVVDPDTFGPGPQGPDIRREFGVPADAFVVGTIGKMAPGRGHDAAIRILAGTSEPAIALLQVGKGESKDRLWQLARSLGVGERNFGTGYQEERLPAIYRAMDAFLFTAGGADQGHRAVLEAMASGLPVVALDVPGIRDFDLLKGAGLVARSEGEASHALDFLATHPAERRAMGQVARRIALRFSGPSFASAAADFYGRVLDFWNKERPHRVTTRGEEHA